MQSDTTNKVTRATKLLTTIGEPDDHADVFNGYIAYDGVQHYRAVQINPDGSRLSVDFLLADDGAATAVFWAGVKRAKRIHHGVVAEMRRGEEILCSSTVCFQDR